MIQAPKKYYSNKLINSKSLHKTIFTKLSFQSPKDQQKQVNASKKFTKNQLLQTKKTNRFNQKKKKNSPFQLKT